jgi:tRNA A-37 threonylcarbamoyl transferase component Bud32
MNDAIPCPKCGDVLPADAPQGLCPRCLAALNFATETMPPDASILPHEAPLKPEELEPHFPQLEILECLGRGGMGVVYKARQKSLNRLVALKLLAPERAGDAKFAIRFAREAQALATLSHPHIVTIHDFGQAGGFYFLLMEFIDGVNLRQAMKAGRFTPDQALAIVPPVCEALQYAHEHGIVHRDIKPENLLLDKTGRVKIADFGIAKIIDLDEAVEAPREDSRTTMAGTPAYAAPEQQGGQADHRADIYSLGVVLYELLTGELPGKNLAPPSQRVQIDVRLDEVVLRALETQPELRYATAAEFRTRLQTFATRRKPSPPPSTSRVAAAFAAVWTLTAFPIVSYVVDGLRMTNTVVIAAWLLVILAVVLGVLAPGFVTQSRHRRWLRGSSWLAWVLAVPAWGFGVFFLDALMRQNGPWNPAVSEAFVVPLIWLACLILPVSALVLRGAAAEPPRAFTRWGRLVFISLVVFAAAVGIMRYDHERRQALASAELRRENAVLEAKKRVLADAAASSRRMQLENEHRQLVLEMLRLGGQLGEKHPQITAIDAQLRALEKLMEQDAAASRQPGDPQGLFRVRGRHRLNDRFEVQLDVPVKGEQPSDGEAPVVMRGYTLRSKADDGAAAVMTYVPLAMEGEPFIAYWDEALQQLWLASPTVVSRHSLPVDGSPDHEMQFVIDMSSQLSQRRPAAVIEAMEAWIKTIAILPSSAVPETDPSKPQADEKTLREFLQKPQNALGVRMTLFVTARRMHAFDDAIPDRESKEAIEIAAGSTRGLAFIPKGSPASPKASGLITWDESKPCLITLRWQTDGKTRWLEVLAIK